MAGFRIVIGGMFLLLPTAARAAAPAGPQQIGAWMLECPGTGGCTLRHRAWILPPGPGRPSAALEVQRRGEALVPVVTLRGLSAQMAVGGLLVLKPQVGLRFDAGPVSIFPCSLDGETITCAPEDPGVAAAAAALPAARTLAVQVSLGGTSLPGSNLDLQGTTEALARLRSAGAAGEMLPAEPGLDWIGFLDRVLRAAGVQGGAAALVRSAGR